MKILLIGDASNYHRALATGLQRLGCEVAVASSGSGFMQTGRDIDLKRPFPGKAGGMALWLKLLGPLRRKLRGYDIVSCSSPIFIEQKPRRVRELFRNLKRDNGAVFLSALGTDLPFIEECTAPDSRLRYSEFRQQGRPGPLVEARPTLIDEWHRPELRDWCDEFYACIDGAVTALYEYQLSVARRLPPEKIAYGGIPIVIDELAPVRLPERPCPVKIFLGRHRHRMAVKGTDRLEAAARRAMNLRPGKGELVIVENLPYAEYIRLLRSAHIVIDQAYSYTPATNALLAMGYGIPVVSGAEQEYYDFIGQPATPGLVPSSTGTDGTGFTPGDFDLLRPVINTPIDIEGMTRMFCHLLDHPEALRPLGIASRNFVAAHNACEIVAGRFLDFWKRRLAVKGN